MTPTVRFAPSPTGLLHVGNARTALVNWLFARRYGGAFVLRFDDTDRERSREAFRQAIEADLHWLGLDWDRSVRQSERLAAYADACGQLRAEGRLYACYETPEELEYKRKRQLARGRPPIYDRAGLRLDEAARQRLESEGRRPHWRFLLLAETVGWTDLVRGRVDLQADHMSDPVVIRADGTFLYMLPSVIDDIDLGISHVIRGEDHVANTAVQIQMFRSLNAEPPQFAHLPLLTDIHGHGLSKRLGSMTVASLREADIEAIALSGYLARLGTGESAQLRLLMQDLAAEFDITRYGRATPKFDVGQLRHLNAQVLHESSYAWAAPKLAAIGLHPDHADCRFWEAIRANLEHLSDARYWYEVCFGSIKPVVRDPDVTALAADLLPPEPWTEQTWQAWTAAVKAATGRNGKALFQPLRLAITGREHGPELRSLLPLVGRARAETRLRHPPTPAAAAPAAAEAAH